MKKEYKGTCNGATWTASLCDDFDEYKVYLDLGNGKPEHIGYAADQAAIQALVCDELDSLAQVIVEWLTNPITPKNYRLAP